ncbi:S1 family peptidase [Streptomyces scopuliridis]|uniref:S1 family peptidase n=1 Tax=Streptomyces scopuliridis TaxID=452529 RepID=UPI0036A78D54
MRPDSTSYRTEEPFRRAVRTAVSAVAALTLLLGWFAATGSTAYAQETGVPATAPTTAAVEVRGGDVLYSNIGTRCTVGFNARGGSTTYGIVSGRCAQGATTWYADSALNVVVGTSDAFPARPELIRYTSTSVAFPGEVRLGANGPMLDITGAARPYVGQSICHTNGGSGVHCGTVTAVNVTINFPEGIMTGVIKSNTCSEAGAAGSPAFSGSTALGIILDVNQSCSAGGSTFYQSIVDVLSKYGLSLY